MSDPSLSGVWGGRYYSERPMGPQYTELLEALRDRADENGTVYITHRGMEAMMGVIYQHVTRKIHDLAKCGLLLILANPQAHTMKPWELRVKSFTELILDGEEDVILAYAPRNLVWNEKK